MGEGWKRLKLAYHLPSLTAFLKGKKKTWKHVICYYSGLRMHRTKERLFQKSLPSSPNPSLFNPLLLWPRRVKEGALEGEALEFEDQSKP